MDRTLRSLTIVNALIYFGAALYHSGVLVAAAALGAREHRGIPPG
jgi:hypothetical protein